MPEPRSDEEEPGLEARIFARLGDAVVLVRAADGTVVHHNAAAERLFAASETLRGHSLVAGAGGSPPAGAPTLRASALGPSLSRQGRWEGDAALERMDGTGGWCEVVASAFTDAVHGEVWLLSCRDVTAKRRAEEVLVVKEAAIATALNGVAIATPDGALTYVNEAFLRLWGYGQASDVLGRSALSFWQDPAAAAEVVARLHATGSWRGELVARRLDGAEVTFDVAAHAVRDERGQPVALMASFADATERARAERERRAAEARTRASDERYRRAERGTNDGLWEWDMDSGEGYVSPRWAQILGYEPDAVPANVAAFSELIHPDERAAAWAAIERHERLGEPYDVELRIRHKDGRYVWVRARGVVTPRLGDAPRRMTGSIGDISREKHAEARLLEAHRIAGLGAWERDLESMVSWWSPQQYALLGIEPGTPVAPDSFLRCVHPDDRARLETALQGLLKEEETSRELHYRIVRPDGEVRSMYGVATVSRDGSGRPIRVAGTNQDVTARVRAEEAIRRSLAEKETLLREIHHRVKNNLQIVSSLLYFQGKKLCTPDDARVFEELRQRIKAMSLVHERLYESGDVARVDFARYVRGLVHEMSRMIGGAERVSIVVEAEDVHLPIEAAMPAGMIVCELVTNVLKYAYPDGRPGTSVVSVRQAGARVVLSVEDGGVGLPPGIDAHAGGSFGWDLVRLLAKQLDAALAVEGVGGVRVRVEFPAG